MTANSGAPQAGLGHAHWAYRPITEPPQASWPGGKRLAMYVAVGLEEYRFGVGRTEDVIGGITHPDLVNTAWRDYGNRVGAFRLFDKLTERGIAPTVLVNSGLYQTAPEVLRSARQAGAEFVAHGESNSDVLTDMDAGAELAYVRRVSQTIGRQEGRRPGGWSTPWLTHTPHTLANLAEAGYRYLLDLRIDDRPVWLDTAHGPLLSLPYALELNDSTSMIGRGVATSEFADMIVDEFDELLEVSADQPLVASLVLHSFISGAPFRLRQLGRALDHLAARSGQVWFTQPHAIYRQVAASRADDGEQVAS